MMLLLTSELRQRLRINAVLREMHGRRAWPEPDPAPVVKFFNPLGAATWLATELDRDDDTLFGLADLGFGSPEMGTFSLSEIASVRLPFGMGIERDISFETMHPISVWAEWSRRAGSILHAETLLRRAAANELPSADG
jgi:hypothetical protein